MQSSKDLLSNLTEEERKAVNIYGKTEGKYDNLEITVIYKNKTPSWKTSFSSLSDSFGDALSWEDFENHVLYFNLNYNGQKYFGLACQLLYCGPERAFIRISSEKKITDSELAEKIFRALYKDFPDEIH